MFLVGFFVVREDIKTKRILNKFILIAISLGAFFYLCALITGIIDLAQLTKIAINTLISFVISFIIWKFGLWPAGDAKLFITFSFLLPFQYYTQTYLVFFPAFAFLINICVVYLVFVALKAIPWIWRSLLKLYQRGCFKREFLEHYSRRKGRVFLRVIQNRESAWKLFFRVCSNVLCVAMVAIFFTKRSFRLQPFLVCFLFYGFSRLLFEAFVNFHSRKRIRISEVRAGMNLSEESIKQLKVDQDFFRGLDILRAEGLTERQSNLIREHLAERKIPAVYVYDTIPFSPFIVLGAVTTIFAHGSLLYFVIPLIQKIAGD